MIHGAGVSIDPDLPISGQSDLDHVVDGLVTGQLIQGEPEQYPLYLQAHEARCDIQADKAGMDVFAANERCEVRRIVGDGHIAVFDGASNDGPNPA